MTLFALLKVFVNGDNDSFFLRLLQNELDETLKKVPIEEANNNYLLAKPMVAKINLTAVAFKQLLSQYKDKDPDMNDVTVQAKYKKVQKDLDMQFQTLVQQYTGINITEII